MRLLYSPTTTFWTYVVVAPVIVVVVANAAVSDNPNLNSIFADALSDVSLTELIPLKPSATSGLNESCFNVSDGYDSLKNCLSSQCASREDLARLYKTQTTSRLLSKDVGTVAPGVLYVLTQRFRRTQCMPTDIPTPPHEKQRPGAAAVWGYSFLFVTLINLCSLFGILISACMKFKVYKLILIFMVALAVGTLVGSGLLVLIPEALELGQSGDHHYIWKICAVLGGIYLFFIIERVMRMINNYREKTREAHEQDEEATQDTVTASFQMHATANPSILEPMPDSPSLIRYTHNNHHHHNNSNGNAYNNLNYVDDEGNATQAAAVSVSTPPDSSVEKYNAEKLKDTLPPGKSLQDQKPELKKPGDHAHGHSHGVAPVAYMIVFGDAMHNFIDGLSIGAAFSETTMLGVSVAVAVLCEELPHELGDFAILLNSGLSTKRALCYNFLSSLSCYVGLVIGILLGENTSANTWIFAIAGGMFLYISLTDMLPEMNSAAESEEGEEFGQVKTFILQNIGLIIGYGIILILAVYGGEISFDPSA